MLYLSMASILEAAFTLDTVSRVSQLVLSGTIRKSYSTVETRCAVSNPSTPTGSYCLGTIDL